MSALAGVVWAFVGLLASILAYAALCIVALFYVPLPDRPPFNAVEDLIFVLTLPFVVGVILASSVRGS